MKTERGELVDKLRTMQFGAGFSAREIDLMADALEFADFAHQRLEESALVFRSRVDG